MALRVTLSRTFKVLLPAASFVITSQAYLYMEILNVRALYYSPLLILCTIVEAFSFVYCYALTINSHGVTCYQRDYE